MRNVRPPLSVTAEPYADEHADRGDLSGPYLDALHVGVLDRGILLSNVTAIARSDVVREDSYDDVELRM